MADDRRHTRRQLERDDAVPRGSPDMAAQPWAERAPGAPVGRSAGPGLPAPQRPIPTASYALQPPDFFQPPGGSTIRVQGSQLAQDATFGEVTLAAGQLLRGAVGILRIINVGVSNLLSTSAIVFRVRVASAIVDGWEWSPFPQPVAVFQQEFPPESTMIYLPEAVDFALTAQVNDAGTYDVAGMVQGWRYGQELRDNFERAWRRAVLP